MVVTWPDRPATAALTRGCADFFGCCLQGEPGRQVVQAVYYHIASRQQTGGIGLREIRGGHVVHRGVDGRHPAGGGVGLGGVHEGPGAEKLAVEVVPLEPIPVDEDQGAHSGAGQDFDDGSAEAAEADDPTFDLSRATCSCRRVGLEVAGVAFRDHPVFKGGDFHVADGERRSLRETDSTAGQTQRPTRGAVAECDPLRPQRQFRR